MVPSVLTNLLLVGGGAYVALMTLLFIAQRRLMYHPTDERPIPAAYGLFRATSVEVPSHDGLSLFSWWQPPKEPSGKVVLYFHGNGGSIAGRADRAQYFAGRGYGLLFPSYRYNAGAEGAPSEEALVADAAASYDWLLSKGVQSDQIVVYGESLGTGVAVALANRRKTAALVLEAPYSSIADVAQSVYWYMPAKWLVHDRFDSTELIGKLDIPILIVHGGEDRVIPIRFAQVLHEKAPRHASFVVLPQAGHDNLYSHGMADHLSDFLDRNLLSSMPKAVLEKQAAG